MPTINDKDLGDITVRRSASARAMKATVAPNGQLRISIPSYMPLFMARRLVNSSRGQLRELLETRPKLVISDGMQIGKSHSLHVRYSNRHSLARHANQLILTLTQTETTTDSSVVEEVRKELQSILRREAKHHLPRRLEYLANTYGFSYSSLRFTHASSRWGSCNSKQAISLNIGLMKLPFELIDYVLIHELCHTKYLDHSIDFWNEVAKADPSYKQHRKLLKLHTPSV